MPLHKTQCYVQFSARPKCSLLLSDLIAELHSERSVIRCKKCRVLLTGPLMVPEASRSPGLRLQPDAAWWTSCCFAVQYRYCAASYTHTHTHTDF